MRTNYIRITELHSHHAAARCALLPSLALLYWFSNSGTRDNAGLQRRARTAASYKPCMRDKLIARPLQGFVIPPRIAKGFPLPSRRQEARRSCEPTTAELPSSIPIMQPRATPCCQVSRCFTGFQIQGRGITPAFSCGARSAFKRKERSYLKTMLSRRQLQGFVRHRRS
jgi:hypothetical protein